MLTPRKVKYRKMQRGGKMARVATRGTTVSFGDHGIRALTGGQLSARQIEAARRAMTRFVQRGGKIWIRIFPDKPITKKGSEVPMGSGKGAVDHYVAVVKPGVIIFEIGGVEPSVAKEALRLAGHKLSVKTTYVKRETL